MGRPLTVRNNGALLASSMSYHANGSLAQAAYANGYQFTQALNARGLPQQLYVSDGAQVALDQSMTYDARGNLTQLTDAAVPCSLAMMLRTNPLALVAVVAATMFTMAISNVSNKL